MGERSMCWDLLLLRSIFWIENSVTVLPIQKNKSRKKNQGNCDFFFRRIHFKEQKGKTETSTCSPYPDPSSWTTLCPKLLAFSWKIAAFSVSRLNPSHNKTKARGRRSGEGQAGIKQLAFLCHKSTCWNSPQPSMEMSTSQVWLC